MSKNRLKTNNYLFSASKMEIIMTKLSGRLTAKMLNKLRAGESAYGSNVRATRNKSGSITFYASFAVGGTRYQKRLGVNDKIKLTDALREAAHFRSEKEREHEIHSNDSAKSTMNFREAVPLFMEYEEKNGGRNRVEKDQHFRCHILPALGSLQIKKFSSREAKNFKNVLRQKGLKDGTIKRIFATISYFYTYAISEDWLHLKPYKIEIKDETAFRRERIPERHKFAMLSVAKQSDQHPMIFLFMLIGFEVGMRHREILTLRFENINYDAGKVWLPKSKVGPRWQPLTPLVLEELKKIQEMRSAQTGYVFHSDNAKTGHINRMNHAFKRVCKAANVPTTYTPHYMRHSCVSELVEMGFNDRQVASYTGHKTAAMISWYAKPEITPDQADAMKARSKNLVKEANL